MKVGIEVQRAAKALEQRDRADLVRLMGKAGLLHRVRGDATVDNPKPPSHEGRTAGDLETQRIRDAA